MKEIKSIYLPTRCRDDMRTVEDAQRVGNELQNEIAHVVEEMLLEVVKQNIGHDYNIRISLNVKPE